MGNEGVREDNIELNRGELGEVSEGSRGKIQENGGMRIKERGRSNTVFRNKYSSDKGG